MELSREILKRFAQIANGNSNKKQTTPSYMNATAVVSDGVKYVQIDGSDQMTPVSETMGIQNGDRVLVTIENHQATVIGNYSYPADARTANEALSVGGQALTAAGQAIQRIDVLQASSITTENLQAGLATIGYLTATELRALNATVDTLDAKAITTDTLETESAKIGFVKAAQIEGTYATIEQLNAATARIGTLETDTLKSKDLESEVGKFGYLKADEAKLTYATIEQLNAKTVTADEILGVVIKAGYLTADNADLKYATIGALNAATARIGTLETNTLKTKDLESEVGKFGYLKASNLESEVGEFGYLKADDAEVTYATIGALNAEAAKITNLNADFAQFQSAVTQDIVAAKGWMAEGSIGDAQISKVSANKLDAGTIDTSVVTVKSSDGKLQIADNTLQISDANRVRVQVGKDGTGDYTLAVWDVNGQLIWDALGATENTIQRAIIRDSMVSGDAAIQALKIDFQSFETALTEQGIVISGTVVQVGDKSLNVALTEQSQTISDNYTSLVSYTDTAKAAAISTAASDATTKANSALSSAKTYVDEAVEGIEIGGRNLVLGTSTADVTNWYHYGWGGDWITYSEEDRTYRLHTSNGWRVAVYDMTDYVGENITISCDVLLQSISTNTEKIQLSIYESSDSTNTGSLTLSNRYTIDTTDTWYHYEGTITLSKPYLGFYIRGKDSDAGTGTAYVLFKNVKFEKGNKATDWTPAPEDTQSQIDNTNATIATHTETLSTHTSHIAANESAIALRVTAQDFNSYKTTVNEELTSAKSRLTTAESSITAMKGEIALKVEQTDIDTAVNGIEIGGRNLVIGSNVYRKDTPMSFTSSETDCNVYYTDMYMPCEINETYTLQCCTDGIWGDHTITGTATGWTHIFVLLMTDETSIGNWVEVINLYQDPTKKLTGRQKWKFTVPDDGNAYTKIMFRFDIHSDGSTEYTVRWWDLKVEKGNKATDWTPAPEDIDASIADVDAKFANYSTTTKMTAAITAAKDNITQSVSATYATKSDLSTTNSNVSSLTTRVSSAESKLTKDSLVTTIGSYYSTQTYVDEAVDGIEIGGRNLLEKTNQGTTSWNYSGNDGTHSKEAYEDTDGVKGVKLICETASSGWAVASFTMVNVLKKLLPNTEYTISCEILTNVSSGAMSMCIKNMNATLALSNSVQKTLIGDESWHKYEWKITTNDLSNGLDAQILYIGDVNHIGYWIIKNLKMEIGTKATDWTPAPEDTQSQITSVKTIATQTADKFNWIVASGTSATDFTLTDRTATLIAETISLNGDVKVNGDMLVDGSITTDKLYAYSVTTEKLATDAIKSSNYSYSSGNFSSAGTFLDLTTGLIRSKNFAITSDGSAYFSGELHSIVGKIGGWTLADNCLYTRYTDTNDVITTVALQNTVGASSFGYSYASFSNCTATINDYYIYATPIETGESSISIRMPLKVGSTTVYVYSGYAALYSDATPDVQWYYKDSDGMDNLGTIEFANESDIHTPSDNTNTVVEYSVDITIPNGATDAYISIYYSMPSAVEGETYVFKTVIEQNGVSYRTVPILSAAGVAIDKFLAVKKTDADGTETMPLYMSANGTIYTEGTVTAGSLYRYDTSADLSYTVLDTGNYTTTLDARYLQLTGGTINGNVYLNNPDTNTPLYITGNAINESSICYKYTGISYNWVVGPGAGYSDFSKFGWYKSDVGALAYLSSDGVFTVTSQVNVGGKVALFADREGGNIQIVSPDGTLWEMDAIGNSYVRLFNYTTYKNLNFYSDGGLLVQGQITAGSSSANAFRAVYGDYGLIMRNDGNAFYFLATNSGDPYGAWNTSYYPLSYKFASNEMRINGSVFTSSYVRLLGNNYAIQFGTGFSSGTTSLTPRSTSGGKADGVVVLGASSSRWSTCFAKNGTSTSSDERDKEIFELDQRYKALFMKTKTIAYRWTDDDSKIIHIGTGAQSFEQSAHECGLSTEEIGAIRHDYWDEPNEDGRTDRYSINYDELLMLAVPFVQSHELTLTEHAAKLINIEAQLEAMKVELDEAHMKIAAQDKVIAELEKLVNAS